MTAIALLLGAIVLAVALRSRFYSFRAQSSEDYAAAGPQFDVRERLNGPIACEGVIFGPTGRVSSRFEADFEAEWQGNVGIMREHFRYDSGNEQHREWRLTLGNDGSIRGEAADLIGPALGKQAGNSVRLDYRIKLTDAAGGHVLRTTDWMYLTESGTIVNRSQFRKFGITVGELVATMWPKAAA